MRILHWMYFWKVILEKENIEGWEGEKGDTFILDVVGSQNGGIQDF